MVHAPTQCLNLNDKQFIEDPSHSSTWVWPLMNQYAMFFFQTSTLTLCTHLIKLTKHWRCCMNNTKSLPKSCWARGKMFCIDPNLKAWLLQSNNISRGNNPLPTHRFASSEAIFKWVSTIFVCQNILEHKKTHNYHMSSITSSNNGCNLRFFLFGCA